jgi:hypothetical protein
LDFYLDFIDLHPFTRSAKYLGLHSHGRCVPLLPAEFQDKAEGGNWNSKASMLLFVALAFLAFFFHLFLFIFMSFN